MQQQMGVDGPMTHLLTTTYSQVIYVTELPGPADDIIAINQAIP
jgi:hypothetical protein